MKRAAIYARVSTLDQHVETQLIQLRELAKQRGLEIVQEYSDKGISGSKSRRPALDQMLRDARSRKFSVLLVAAFDRLARSTKDLLFIVDELESLGVEFHSAREQLDTNTAMGRMFLTLLGSIGELERNILSERIRLGMHRARLQGQRMGREPLDVDRDAVVRDRLSGMSLTQCANKHGISRASVIRLARAAKAAEDSATGGELVEAAA